MALDPSVLQTQHMNWWNTAATAEKWWITDSWVKNTLNNYTASVNSVNSWGSALNWSGSGSSSWGSSRWGWGWEEDPHAWCRERERQLNETISQQKQEIADLKQQIKELTAENTQLKQQVAQLTAENEQLTWQVQTLESRVSSLQSKLNKQWEYKDDFDPSMDAAAEKYNNAEFWKTTEENVNNSTIENPNDNGDAVTTATEDTNTWNRLSNSFSRLWYTLWSNNTNTDTAKTTTSEVVNPVDNVNKTFDVILNEWWTVNDMKAKAQQAFDQAKEQLKQSVNSKEEYVQLLNQLKQHPLFKAIQ